MKICQNCGAPSQDSEMFCRNCGANIANVSVQPEPPMGGNAPVPPAQNFQPAPPAPFPVYTAPVFPEKRKFSWYDISTLVGFVSSVVGLFWCSIFLLPLAAVTSFLGFKGNKTKGLAVAGIVISIIGILIKIGYILYTTGLLPAWFTGGIFG